MATQGGHTPIFIDSHAHLADAAFSGDRDAVIARARSAGAGALVCIGESLATAAEAGRLAAANPGFVFATAGIHPHDAVSFDAERDIPALRAHLESGAVAVGECGLDYHYDNSPRAMQLAAFSAQIALAAEVGRPLVVHTREAEDDTRAVIDQARQAGVPGVLHCYTGSHALATHALAAGWYVSFSGIVTFRKWADDDLLRLVPADRLLVESDSPYLAPVPFRGKRNEPAWVPHTLARVAAARGVDAGELGRITADNARRLFGLAMSAAT
ncbi:MAG TPA: TatD family hydrolase [Gemmatimonadaceae bacterium]|nr:TatD family hydrolase [Gemmatimonadaceae bacterium]